jgi:UDP-galactopyranose mutase
MWGVVTPEQAQSKLSQQRAEITSEPQNLEEHAISLVGSDIYEKLVKGYTEKQWGRSCKELPSSILKRLPVRFTYDNNYYNDLYQGIPIGGYTRIIEQMLSGCEVRTNVDFNSRREIYLNLAETIIYTGTIDSFYDMCFGPLEYRSLRFEVELLDKPNYQGVAVVNYTDRETPYTRIIEHKHFEFGKQPKTIISREYPLEWTPGLEPYYPINDTENQARYEKYADLAAKENKIIFGGRLGEYRYYDMQDTIASALKLAKNKLNLKNIKDKAQ